MMHANVNTINPSNYNNPAINQVAGTSYTHNTYNNVVKAIQNHYLVQNENGTFSIKKVAYELYPKTIMNQITQGMDAMNIQILSGNIKFKVNSNKEVTVQSVNQNAVNNSFFSNNNYEGMGYNFMSDQFVHEYCYNFHYNWSGFYCAVNLQGCATLIRELNLTIASAGGLTALSAITGNLFVSSGCAVEAVYASLIQSNLQIGLNSGRGATISAWGSPMGKSVIYYANPNN